MAGKTILSQLLTTASPLAHVKMGLRPFIFAGTLGLALSSPATFGADINTSIYPGGASGSWNTNILIESGSKTTVNWGSGAPANGKTMDLTGEILNNSGENGGTLFLRAASQPGNTATWVISGDSNHADKFSGSLVLDNRLWGSIALNLSGNKLSEATIDFSKSQAIQGVNRYKINLTGDAVIAGLVRATPVGSESAPIISGQGALRTLTLQGDGVYDYAGEVGGNISLSKKGAGTQTFSGKYSGGGVSSILTVEEGVLEVAKTFNWTGNVNVSTTAGKLKISNVWAVSSGKNFSNAGTVEIGSSGKLDVSSATVSGDGKYLVDGGDLTIGSKNISGSVALLNGGTLNTTSAEVGALSVSKGSTLNGLLSTSVLEFALSDSFTGLENVYLNVAVADTLSFTGSTIGLDLVGIDGAYSDGDSLIFNLGLDNQSSITAEHFEDAYGWDGDGMWLFDSYENGQVKLVYTTNIPEPSTFGLLAGLGALALVVSRRRRSRRN